MVEKQASLEEAVGPIRGQGASMFWTSDSDFVYTATPILVYHCGRCGVAIDMDAFRVRCYKGHLNELKGLRTKY